MPPDLWSFAALLLIGSGLFAGYHASAWRAKQKRIQLALYPCPRCQGATCERCDWTGLGPVHRV